MSFAPYINTTLISHYRILKNNCSKSEETICYKIKNFLKKSMYNRWRVTINRLDCTFKTVRNRDGAIQGCSYLFFEKVIPLPPHQTPETAIQGYVTPTFIRHLLYKAKRCSKSIHQIYGLKTKNGCQAFHNFVRINKIKNCVKCYEHFRCSIMKIKCNSFIVFITHLPNA